MKGQRPDNRVQRGTCWKAHVKRCKNDCDQGRAFPSSLFHGPALLLQRWSTSLSICTNSCLATRFLLKWHLFSRKPSLPSLLTCYLFYLFLWFIVWLLIQNVNSARAGVFVLLNLSPLNYLLQFLFMNWGHQIFGATAVIILHNHVYGGL